MGLNSEGNISNVTDSRTLSENAIAPQDSVTPKSGTQDVGHPSRDSLNNWMRRPVSNPRVDEAHFWLNGYVNKQNCRIWSEANPQVYVETPLHPEKLTVWCALWAGGILLQKR
ncbi:hypothetical protein TNCV_2068611 [Trichonephila clavipes]|uniref:Uncharacterized protein n=1 Tax=Trichonephila clavipes TaxID=2585209 RepID=A0A8X7BD34_TRICX|nr:hypothetical protein TNCV_2068611 [Trichonephila clavipes]